METSPSPSLVPIPTHNGGLFSALAQSDTVAQEEEALFDQRDGHHVPRLHPVVQGPPAPSVLAETSHNLTEGGPLGHTRSFQFWDFFKLVVLFFFSVLRDWSLGSGFFDHALGWFAGIHHFMFAGSPIS